MPVKYVFVTGGVVSGLGKGITAASLGRLLKARGYKVTMQKFDPYINIDPGTMNPIQHGEVFVTDDGAETDLDLGHYERFIAAAISAEVLSRLFHTSRKKSKAVFTAISPLKIHGLPSSKSAERLAISKASHSSRQSASSSTMWDMKMLS
jgi:uncharacterized protein with NAD-binding domain and iron-sulfur cluster